MTLEKVLKKILSVTLIVAFVSQQGGLAFAASDVSTWGELQTAVASTPDEYNVTTALTAADSPNGTLDITADGYAVTGAALTENGTHDTLVNVNSGITFGLGNAISGSIVNDGTLNYSGASLADGSVTGSGDFNFTTAGDVTNGNSITQGNVTVDGSTNLTNNAAITAAFANSGVVDNNAAITGAITNTGTIGSTADNLNGTVANNGTLNLAGGTVQDAISGTGNLYITTAEVSNDYNINQNWLTASADFTNTGLVNVTNLETVGSAVTVTNKNNITVAEDVINEGTIDNQFGATFGNSAATGSLNNSGTITNAGTFNAYGVSNNTGSSFNNSGNLSFNDVTNEAGAAFSQDAGEMNSVGTSATFDNSGSFYLDGGNAYLAAFSNNADAYASLSDGQLTVDTLQNDSTLDNDATINTINFTNDDEVIGSGKLNINGDSTNNGSITQSLVTIDNNAIFDNNGMLLAKASNLSGSTINTDPDNLGEDVDNDGTLNFIDRGTLSVDVTGDGETNIQKDLDNQGSISQADINISSGAVVTSNASDMTASNEIANEGIINYTAGSTANTITGSGRIDITGYVTNTGDIDQTTVSNSGVFTNNGTVDANLTNTNAIEGTGSLTTKDGISSNKGTIAQANLTNNGTFDNEGHITLTGTLTNNNTFNTNADLLTAAVANEGDLNLTGGTNANVITGAGTTNFSNTVTNNAAITQNTVTNSGTLTNNALITADVTNTGTLTSKGTDISGDIANTGTYVISDGDNANDIIGEGGKLSILGDTENTGTIMQETLTIANSGNLTTDSDLVIATITNDGKLEWNAGSANENVVNGSGQLDITGGDITNSASIEQGKIKITGGSLTSNADLLASTGGITNNVADGLTLTGGTNTNAIDGTGSLTTTGNVTNNATINQDSITVSGGKLTTAADTITTSNGITNNSQISFVSGDNNNEITGTGTTFIDGTVQNLANVYTDVQVNTGAHYGSATDILNKLENRGTTDLIDADIASTGKISGTGVTNILGATVNNSSISQSAVNIAAGASLTTDSGKVEAEIANDGDLIWNAGTGNANVISGNGTLNITGGTIANTAAISQNQINITGGSLTSNADLLASVGGIANDATLGLTGGTNKNVITGNGALTTAGDVTNEADIEQDTVTVFSGSLANEGTIQAEVTINSDAVLASDGDDIDGDITNNGTYAIADGDNDNDITGTGDLQLFGNTTNTGKIAQDTISINTGATFVASNMDDVTTTNGIDNAGIFEMQAGTNSNVITGNTGALMVTGNVINDSGATLNQDNIDIATLGTLEAYASDLVTVNGITNSGNLKLNDGNTSNNISGTGKLAVIGTVTNSGNITQDSLTNTGSFTSNADLLAFANGIMNDAALELTGGTNSNKIGGTGAGEITFSGDVINNGVIENQTSVSNTAVLTNNAAITATDVTNSGTIENNAAITGTIANTGTINSLADNLAGAITNNGTLNISGGAVQDAIDGTGTMDITGDLINDFTIAQATVSNHAEMTNNGAITADFNNDGVVNNNAAITGTIINDGTLNSDVTYLKGAVTNDGTLNADGGTTQNTISGTGEMNILADLTAANNITQDSVNVEEGVTVTNNAVITASAINNDGTIQGAASGLVGDIANEGSLIFDAASTGASNISGTGDVQVTADTTLTGTNSFTGGTLIDGAILTVAGQNNLSTAAVAFANSGKLQVTGADSLFNELLGNASTENVLVQNDDALTLNGTITNAADFRKSGTGTMTLAMASNSYTGDTYVDEGTLIGNTQNINNTVNGAAGTTVEFNDTEDAELNGINTLGTFVQSGNAVLNVQNNAFSALQADINAGTFAANRALTATTLNVNNGATLRGNGTITGDVNVNAGATIAPGNSIDTLTIDGDLLLDSGSTTAIEINETPASDKIVVTGDTTINGSTLTVTNENGRYFEWDSFDILESNNVDGTFSYDGTVANYDANRIDIELDYSDPTKVALTAKRKATSHETVAGLSRDQRQAAKAMDAVSTGFGGDITNALLQLEQLGGLNPTDVTVINPESSLQSALNDLDGVLYANTALTPLFNAKTAHVYDRIAKRNPSAGKCAHCHDNLWAEYYSQYDKVYSNANSPRFTNTMTGVLVGYDRSSDNALLGVYGGFGKSDLRQNNDRMDIEDSSLGVYGGYMGENWLLKGTLLGGFQNYEGKRNIAFMGRKAESKYNGVSVGLDLEASYNIALDSWLNIKPFVGWLNNYSHQQSFTEKGADSLNLHVANHDQFNSQARLGFELNGKIKNRFSWYGSVAVKQFVGDDYAKLHMDFNLPGTRMEIISAELGRTSFSGQVGANYAITNNWSIFANLDTGVSNKAANCYGNVGLAYTW